MKYLFYCLVAVSLSLFASCTGYSKYPIDDNPENKIDKSLLGIWKAVEDTVKEDFILIQSFDRAMEHLIKYYGGSYERYMQSDSDFFKNDTAVLKKKMKHNRWLLNNRERLYFISRINNGGQGIVYQQFSSYISKIGSDSFLNVPYRDENEKGYLLVRMLKVSRDTVTVTVVSDAKMSLLGNSEQVREKVSRFLSDRNFYRDTVRFYKVKSGDFDLNEAIKLAN